MDEQTSSYFEGTVEEAIQKSKQLSKILAVIVYNNEDHPLMLDLLNFEDDLVELIKSSFILIKLESNSREVISLKSTYSLKDELPFIISIGLNNSALQSNYGDLEIEDLKTFLNKSKESYQAQQTQLLMLLMLQQQQQQQQQQKQQQQQQQQQKTQANTQQKSTATKETPSNTSVNKKTESNISKQNESKKTTSTNSNNKITSPKTTSPVSKQNNTKSPVLTSAPLYTETTIVCKLTNGFSLKSVFSPNDKLYEVKSYIDKNRNDGKHPYYLMITYPKKVFTESEMSLSLRQLDLVPSATITLCSLDPTVKPTPAPENQTTETSSSSYTSTSSSLSEENDGYIDKFKNYVSGIFSPFWYPAPANQQPPTSSYSSSSNSTSSSSSSYNNNRIHTIRNDNTAPQQQPQQNKFSSQKEESNKKEEQSNIKKRNRIGQLHQQNDDNDDKDGKNSYYNGNSTQYK